jgi:hypothetical protein
MVWFAVASGDPSAWKKILMMRFLGAAGLTVSLTGVH